jgi:hypothetical protein
VSSFADCSQMNPPADLRVLCDPRSASHRPNSQEYLWSNNTPLAKLTGTSNIYRFTPHMVDQGGYPADPAGDDRQAGGHGLDQHRGQLLVPGGQDQQVDVPQHRGDPRVGREAGEPDRPGQTPGLGFGGAPARAVAHDEQAGRRGEAAERADQRADVFLRAIRPM